MKKQYSMIAITLSLLAGSAIAAGDAGAKAAAAGDTPKGKQQTKMSTCSKEAKAKSLKGPERKQFMSTCLKAKA
jgi:hypothetical protein